MKGEHLMLCKEELHGVKKCELLFLQQKGVRKS